MECTLCTSSSSSSLSRSFSVWSACFSLEVDGGLGHFGELGGLDAKALLFEGLPDLLEVLGLGVDLDAVGGDLDVFGAGVDGGEGELFAVLAVGVDDDHALAFEEPGDAAGLAQVGAGAAHGGTNLGDAAVAVVGDDLDEDGDAARAVALVGGLRELRGIGAAGAALDGAVDGVAGHVGVAGALDGEAEAEVGVGVRATLASGDGYLTAELGEDLAPAGVGDALLAFDLAPVGMTSHATSPSTAWICAPILASRRREGKGREDDAPTIGPGHALTGVRVWSTCRREPRPRRWAGASRRR